MTWNLFLCPVEPLGLYPRWPLAGSDGDRYIFFTVSPLLSHLTFLKCYYTFVWFMFFFSMCQSKANSAFSNAESSGFLPLFQEYFSLALVPFSSLQ